MIYDRVYFSFFAFFSRVKLMALEFETSLFQPRTLEASFRRFFFVTVQTEITQRGTGCNSFLSHPAKIERSGDDTRSVNRMVLCPFSFLFVCADILAYLCVVVLAL